MEEQVEDFVPQNELEALLVQEAEDPDVRPDFYQALVASDVYVLGSADELLLEEEDAAEGTALSLYSWEVDERPVIPIFSTLSRLEAFVDEEATYMRINAGALMTMLPEDVTLLLNPGSAYVRRFPPGELQMLLEGVVFAPDREALVLTDGEVFLGQPAEQPEALLAGLREVFEEQPEVRAAYLAQVYAPESDEPPHLVVGLDMLRDFDEVVEAAVVAAEEALPPGEFVDFIQIGRDALSDYLLHETWPFYERKG
jgi:hypothetical protein